VKLYMHPVSNASRPVRLFLHEKKIACDEEIVDILTGAHMKPPYADMNPSKLVPMLEDGDLRLTESASILRYLANKNDLPEYPKEPRARAKVDELLDWFNTQFYRDFGYGLAYPQIFPTHKRPNTDFHDGVIAWGGDRAKGWFHVLEHHWLAGDGPYLRGEQITIADYFGVSLVTIGEVLRCDFSAYPSVQRWVATMKQLSAWGAVNEAMYGFRDYLKEHQFAGV
jgi:glutathione S-transferase